MWFDYAMSETYIEANACYHQYRQVAGYDVCVDMCKYTCVYVRVCMMYVYFRAGMSVYLGTCNVTYGRTLFSARHTTLTLFILTNS